MLKDTKSLGNNKAPACESRGFVRKKKEVRILTHLPKAFIKQTYGDTWNGQVSTWWLRNASFLRLKSVELGYTLPKDLTAKVGIQKARIYVNGANLFTIDNYKIADPEAGVTRNDNNEVINSNGVLSYPLQRTITFGANITF